MKIHQNKPRSLRAALTVTALIAGALSSALIAVAPASAATAENVLIPIDCSVTGDITVTADPGDLLVFTRVAESTPCADGFGGTLYLQDFNDTYGDMTGTGFLGEMGTFIDGIYTDLTPDQSSLGNYWTIPSDGSLAAELRTLGHGLWSGGAFLPSAESLVAGESVIGVIETDYETSLNRFIWAGPRTDAPDAPVVADLGLALDVGGQVAGSPVTFSGSGLLAGSGWEVAVYSTPTVIASGTVGDDGTYSSTASMPEGLEAGVHSIIATTVNADGTTVTNTIVLAIGEDGALLYKSEPMTNADSDAIAEAGAAAEAAVVVAAAEAAASAGASVSVLAKTGTNGSVSGSLAAAALMLLAGVVLMMRRRRAASAAQ